MSACDVARVLGVDPARVSVLYTCQPVIGVHHESTGPSCYTTNGWVAERVDLLEVVRHARGTFAPTVSSAHMLREFGVTIPGDVVLRVGAPNDAAALGVVTAWPVDVLEADLRGADWSAVRCGSTVLYFCDHIRANTRSYM